MKILNERQQAEQDKQIGSRPFWDIKIIFPGLGITLTKSSILNIGDIQQIVEKGIGNHKFSNISVSIFVSTEALIMRIFKYLRENSDARVQVVFGYITDQGKEVFEYFTGIVDNEVSYPVEINERLVININVYDERMLLDRMMVEDYINNDQRQKYIVSYVELIKRILNQTRFNFYDHVENPIKKLTESDDGLTAVYKMDALFNPAGVPGNRIASICFSEESHWNEGEHPNDLVYYIHKNRRQLRVMDLSAGEERILTEDENPVDWQIPLKNTIQENNPYTGETFTKKVCLAYLKNEAPYDTLVVKIFDHSGISTYEITLDDNNEVDNLRRFNFVVCKNYIVFVNPHPALPGENLKYYPLTGGAGIPISRPAGYLIQISESLYLNIYNDGFGFVNIDLMNANTLVQTISAGVGHAVQDVKMIRINSDEFYLYIQGTNYCDKYYYKISTNALSKIKRINPKFGLADETSLHGEKADLPQDLDRYFYIYVLHDVPAKYQHAIYDEILGNRVVRIFDAEDEFFYPEEIYTGKGQAQSQIEHTDGEILIKKYGYGYQGYALIDQILEKETLFDLFSEMAMICNFLFSFRNEKMIFKAFAPAEDCFNFRAVEHLFTKTEEIKNDLKIINQMKITYLEEISKSSKTEQVNDIDSIIKYGIKAQSLSLKMIFNEMMAQEIARMYFGIYAFARQNINISARWFPQIEMADNIRLADGIYRINKINQDLDEYMTKIETIQLVYHGRFGLGKFGDIKFG